VDKQLEETKETTETTENSEKQVDKLVEEVKGEVV